MWNCSETRKQSNGSNKNNQCTRAIYFELVSLHKQANKKNFISSIKVQHFSSQIWTSNLPACPISVLTCPNVYLPLQLSLPLTSWLLAPPQLTHVRRRESRCTWCHVHRSSWRKLVKVGHSVLLSFHWCPQLGRVEPSPRFPSSPPAISVQQSPIIPLLHEPAIRKCLTVLFIIDIDIDFSSLGVSCWHLEANEASTRMCVRTEVRPT